MALIMNHAPTALLILAGVLIVFGALLGLLRGFKRAFIRFLTVLVAFFGSLFACRFFLTDTKRVLEHPWTQKLLALLKVTFLDQLQEQVPEAYDLLIGLPVAILSPIFFTVLFLVAAFVLEIVSMILGFFAGPKRSGHLIGGVIGAVQGAVFTVALMVPLCGLLTNAVSAIDTIEAEKNENYNVAAVSQLSEYKEQMTAVTEAPIYKMVDTYAGSPICKSLMRYKVDGKEVSIKDETDNVARLYAHIFPLIGTNIKEYKQDQIQALYKVTEDLDRSELFPRLITTILNAAGKAWSEDEGFLSVSAPEASGDFKNVMIELFNIMETTSTDPVSDDPDAKSVIASDLKTLVDLMDVFEKHGIFPIIDDGDAMKNKMASDPSFIPEVRRTLRSNDRYKPVCDALERAVVSSVVSVPDKDSPDYEKFQDMTEDVATALNGLTDEQRQAFFDDPKTLLDDTTYGDQMRTALQNYDVGEEMMDISKELISDVLNEEFGQKLKDGENVTAEDVEEFLRTHYSNGD
ncbi:MAG: CvpA family protein [Clostridia bacterium]|nr:CvpA family protein [Clostridia bacterium]